VLKLLAGIIFIYLFSRLFRSLARTVMRTARGAPSPQSKPEDKKNKKEPGYSDLTPYDIEDADYEEIRRDAKA